MGISRRALIFSYIPLFAAVLSTCLFVLQKGFWGGHGRFDSWIAYLGLPVTAISPVLEKIPLPEFIENRDLLLIIWFPAFVNIVFFLGVAWLASYAHQLYSGRKIRSGKDSAD